MLIETSFPNRLDSLANAAQHLTPALLQEELKKIKGENLAIHVYHIKVPYFEEVKKEVAALDDSRIHVLADGTTFTIE